MEFWYNHWIPLATYISCIIMLSYVFLLQTLPWLPRSSAFAKLETLEHLFIAIPREDPSWWHGRDICLTMKNMEKLWTATTLIPDMRWWWWWWWWWWRRGGGGVDVSCSETSKTTCCFANACKTNKNSTTKIILVWKPIQYQPNVQHTKHIKTTVIISESATSCHGT